jgi:transposase
MKKIAYVGVDYHLDFLSLAVLVEGEKDFYETIHLPNRDKVIAKYLKKLSATFELKLCYEACSSGYVFQRKVKAWGYHCDVIAPSLIPKKPGDRRKNDSRDARNLAQHYANGMLTVVHPPTEEQESIRSLVRCRFALKEAGKRTKQQINSFLLAQDYHWKKSKWTKQHRWWLSHLELPNEYVQTVLDEHLGHLGYLESRIQYVDDKLEEIAHSQTYAPSVKKLRAFRGIGTLTALLLICEITDFRRFPSPGALMAFLGLIPSENSSGGRQKGGSITKSGNTRCRSQLIESVQHYVKQPRISAHMQERLCQVDGKSATIALTCIHRLHKRYWALTRKGKLRPVAIVAIAREFVGFIWAMMRPELVDATYRPQPGNNYLSFAREVFATK